LKKEKLDGVSRYRISAKAEDFGIAPRKSSFACLLFFFTFDLASMGLAWLRYAWFANVSLKAVSDYVSEIEFVLWLRIGNLGKSTERIESH